MNRDGNEKQRVQWKMKKGTTFTVEVQALWTNSINVANG